MDENKPVEEQENNTQSKEYKQVFSVIILFYIASIMISILESVMFVYYDESNTLTQELYNKPALGISQFIAVSITSILVSLFILVKAEAMRAHNKAPKFYYTVIAVITALIGWFLFLVSSFILGIGIFIVLK